MKYDGPFQIVFDKGSTGRFQVLSGRGLNAIDSRFVSARRDRVIKEFNGGSVSENLQSPIFRYSSNTAIKLSL
jgi:hypothetical protein